MGWFNKTAGFSSILVALLTLCLTLCANAESRFLFPGAILRITPRGSAFSALTTNLPQRPPIGFEATRISQGAVLLKESSAAAMSAKGVATSPREYSRKNDPCYRAKYRRIIKKFAKHGHVTCEQNWAFLASRSPSDPSYSQLYAHRVISSEGAWDVTTGDDSLLVLLVDTGVNYNHPDLKENIWTNPKEVAGDGVDNDLNGYVDDIHGINAITGSGDPMDDQGHGTHVAGTIGASGDNNIGVTGVNWSTKIVAAKFLSGAGYGSTADAIKAIEYGNALRDRGEKVVVSNNSWGGGSGTLALEDAIKASANKGIMFVAAAGNESLNNDISPSYPASYNIPNVISVASVDENTMLSSFSNFGATSVHVAAPGSAIVSCSMDGGYVSKSGTSMASPHVAGVVALVQSACAGTLSYATVKALILTQASVKPHLAGKVSSSAVVNAQYAVEGARSVCANIPGPTPKPTRTPTATPSPTATPTPRPTATITPTPTITPIPPIAVALAPNKPLNAGELVTTSISNIPAATSAMQVSLALYDTTFRKYMCKTKKVPVSNQKAVLTFKLPAAIKSFKYISARVAGDTSSPESRLAIKPPLAAVSSKSQGSRAAKRVCSAIAK